MFICGNEALKGCGHHLGPAGGGRWKAVTGGRADGGGLQSPAAGHTQHLQVPGENHRGNQGNPGQGHLYSNLFAAKCIAGSLLHISINHIKCYKYFIEV